MWMEARGWTKVIIRLLAVDWLRDGGGGGECKERTKRNQTPRFLHEMKKGRFGEE